GVRAFLAAADDDAARAARATLPLGKVPYAELRRAVEASFARGPEPTGDFYLEIPRAGAENVPCHVYVPPTYDPARPLPLVIGLHGIWGNGGQIVKALREEAAQRGYLLACPTTSLPWWEVGAKSQIMTVERHMLGRYAVDTDRVHLLGVSLGGFGVWGTALRLPDRWATVLTAVSGISVTEYILRRDDRTRRLLVNAGQFATWQAHFSADPTMPTAFSRRTHAQLQALGYEESYWEEPGAQHDRPTKELMARAVESGMAWCGSHRREAMPREITYLSIEGGGGCGGWWLTLDDASGTAGVSAVAGAGNEITLAPLGRVRRVTLRLNGQLVDLDRPVRVVCDGRTVFEGSVLRDPAVLLDSARERLDPRALYDARVTVELGGR
ncbi:MAG: hypothetical protein HZA54_09775, partial [Planctomycetes bacterium]|nr:hypothetical protein [Planctomycetota bacterium]